MGRVVIATLAAALASCQAGGARARILAPLHEEGEALLYLEPFQPDAARLTFTVASLALERPDGPPLPLEPLLREIRGGDMTGQRLLAHARLPPGAYPALLVTVTRAQLVGLDSASALLVEPEPTRVALPLVVARGRSTVISLALQLSRAVRGGYRFAPAFDAAAPAVPIPQLSGYVSDAAMAHLAVFDRHRQRVVSALPVGRGPWGVALDPGAGRIHVAIADEDRVQAVDATSGAELQRIQLRGGDRPGELALTRDGRTLVVVDTGANAVSFLDALSGVELGRVNVGEDPRALLVDRGGQRAYVLNRRGNSVTVLDVPNRAVAATFATDATPVRAQLDRAGARLYVACAGSPYLSVFTVPQYALDRRVFVGLGRSALKVDARTDLVYVGSEDDDAVQVFDPFSLMPAARIAMRQGVSYLTIDDTENALVALHAQARTVSFVDLTTRRVTGSLEVAGVPAFLTLPAERR
jgi:YVTN family beta-propeller protein